MKIIKECIIINNEISFTELVDLVSNNKSALICGNGFSINFDSRYMCRNLMDSLYDTHRHILKYYKYTITAKQSFKDVLFDNFENALKEIRKLNTKEKFVHFFDDAVKFADTILGNPKILNWIETENINQKLVFGLTRLDLLKNILEQAKNNVFNVNYEYWTIIIYFILSMRKAPASLYFPSNNNTFVKAVLKGAKSELENISEADEYSIINGVYIYFRFLFSANILLNGDSVNVEKLKKWKFIDLNIINRFLSHFDSLMTTNYDIILENITHRNIGHLHGYFSKNQEMVWRQSLSITYDLNKYNLSTIIIGDYFLSKTVYALIADLAKKFDYNTKIKRYDKIIEENIKDKKSNTVIIFELNIDNDYHIIRSIQVNMTFLKNPHIIYCYFSDEDRKSFESVYNQSITYSEDLSERVKTIKVSYTDSKKIITNVFKENYPVIGFVKNGQLKK